MGSLFEIAKSGIQAYRQALSVTGQNIANVNTEGYSKRDVSLEELGGIQGGVTDVSDQTGLGVRVDSAVYQGYSVTPHYDSMIGKLITYADNRSECIARMKRALEEYVIMGINTNIQMHQKIIMTEEFKSGKYDINFMSTFNWKK